MVQHVMSIKHVILGFLSETPLTGYDLKKKFSDSPVFHWSGNNNQIYKALAELHDEQLVSLEIQHQDDKPPRKIYTLTEVGQTALKQWMMTTPELPQMRNALLMQLRWAGKLTPDEITPMLAEYEEELRVHVLMLREQAKRDTDTTRAFRKRIADHWIEFYERERQWVHELRDLFED